MTKTTNELTMREKIQVIIDEPNTTDYAISKETGLAISSVQRLRSGTFKVENLRLKTVETYLEYYENKYGKRSK